MKAIIYDWHTEIYPTNEEVKELCRPGHGVDTCSWLVIGPNGFECCCLVNRREKGNMVAMRDGCDKVNSFDPTGPAREIIF